MNLTYFQPRKRRMWKTTTAHSTSDLSPKHQTSEISLKTSDLMLKHQTRQHWTVVCIRDVQDPVSGLESGRIQHILNKPDRIRATVLFKFSDQNFQISLFWDLTPTQS